MSKGPEWTLLQRGHTDGQQTYENMLSVTNHQRNANPMGHNEMSHLSKWLSSINQQTTSVGEDVEKRELSWAVSGNTDWCSDCGKQYGVFSKNSKWSYEPGIPLLGIYPKRPKTFERK